ncbi:MAG: dicarboxylate/amino acid:cation symporter [Flavobacteriales bacterium]|nr:dicarboxylate/amino acid:cation symporter [Flavobacteriales bacterium]|tara:strand:- start:53142 stop:54410 length:1269 start_codon:yes stop_codon:yes gene_type:complete
MKMNLALHWKIIIGMVLGTIFGITASNFGLIEFTNYWIKPWGTIFVNLLKLIAIPLVFVSIVKGVSSLKDISKLSSIGSKTIGLYLISTAFSVTIGLVLVNLISPGNSISQEKSSELKQTYKISANIKINDANKVEDSGPLQFIIDIVPSNIIDSASENKNMLQIIFFALIFGISMVLIDSKKTQYVKGFIEGLNDIILKIVDIIMLFSPYGVFALLASLISDFGASSDLFVALGMYCFTVVLGLLLMIFMFYPFLLKLFTKVNYSKFFSSISPAQMLAFSTSSSAATLPVTMERCEEKLGISKEVSSFVLPLGATINMDGTSLYQAVAAVFIAQAFGYDLDLSSQLTIVLTATLASIGAAAVPGAGMVMLVIVLSSVGIDPAGIALIFAVDRILDMFRTVVNVTGDATIATIINSRRSIHD